MTDDERRQARAQWIAEDLNRRLDDHGRRHPFRRPRVTAEDVLEATAAARGVFPDGDQT